MRAIALGAGCTALTLLAAGCGATEADDSGEPTAADGLQVVVAFYPLEYLAERIGGDLISISTLAQPGAEPHDLELSPQQVEQVGAADIVLYLAGFQPAIDDAIESGSADSLNLLETTELAAGFEELGHDEKEGHEEQGHEEEGHEGTDPHVWLDPTKYAELATAVGDRLADEDSDNADIYRANSTALVEELEDLDQEFSTGLNSCERAQIVTTHNAFGYLAERYGLEQVGIAGLSPDDEPSPQDLEEVRQFAEENGVTTIFYEESVTPEYAETVAGEVGAETAVLSPLEVVDEGEDYLFVMRENLSTLQDALGCG